MQRKSENNLEYSEAVDLRKLEELLDGYLIGNWRKHDYEHCNARTKIEQCFQKKLLIASFETYGVVEGFKYMFVLTYEENDSCLTITHVKQLNNKGVYSDGVIKLLQGYMIRKL